MPFLQLYRLWNSFGTLWLTLSFAYQLFATPIWASTSQLFTYYRSHFLRSTRSRFKRRFKPFSTYQSTLARSNSSLASHRPAKLHDPLTLVSVSRCLTLTGLPTFTLARWGSAASRSEKALWPARTKLFLTFLQKLLQRFRTPRFKAPFLETYVPLERALEAKPYWFIRSRVSQTALSRLPSLALLSQSIAVRGSSVKTPKRLIRKYYLRALARKQPLAQLFTKTYLRAFPKKFVPQERVPRRRLFVRPTPRQVMQVIKLEGKKGQLKHLLTFVKSPFKHQDAVVNSRQQQLVKRLYRLRLLFLAPLALNRTEWRKRRLRPTKTLWSWDLVKRRPVFYGLTTRKTFFRRAFRYFKRVRYQKRVTVKALLTHLAQQTLQLNYANFSPRPKSGSSVLTNLHPKLSSAFFLRTWLPYRTLTPLRFFTFAAALKTTPLLLNLPPYGFLYLVNPRPNFSRAWRQALKVQLYSFPFFRTVKTFFLAKASLTLTPAQTSLPVSELRSDKSSGSTIPYFEIFSFEAVQPQFWARNVPNEPKLVKGVNLTHVNRIRFKPGYSKIWRSARTALKFLLNLNFLYQRQLTRFLVKFYKLTQVLLLRYFELRLSNFLTLTNLSPDVNSSTHLVLSRAVFLNGRQCLNGEVILHFEDFIQISVSLKYYVLFKWLLNLVKQKKTRLKKFVYVHRVKLLQNKSTLMTTRFPPWIRNTLFSFSDIPKYSEVDFFSLSAFLIYEPFLFTDFTSHNSKLATYNILNLYNWKYLT